MKRCAHLIERRADGRCPLCVAAKKRRYKARHPAHVKAAKQRQRGLPLPLWPAPIHCELCGCAPTSALHLDRDHTTGNFRGWICRLCNLGLGMFRDNPVLLRRAADYVEIMK